MDQASALLMMRVSVGVAKFGMVKKMAAPSLNLQSAKDKSPATNPDEPKSE